MEQGGSADGILQVRADRIQSDVDELMKALTERCTKHKLNVKSAALFEMPKGMIVFNIRIFLSSCIFWSYFLVIFSFIAAQNKPVYRDHCLI